MVGQFSEESESVVREDFCTYVNRSLDSDCHRFKALTHDFKLSESFNFPTSTEYGKKQSFKLIWLKEHNWLVYSPKENGAYCRVCVLFGDTNERNGTKIDRLVKSPISFWTTAKQKFKQHELHSQVQKTALLKADTFLKVMQQRVVSIDQQLNAVVASQVAKNREKLHPIVKNNFALW